MTAEALVSDATSDLSPGGARSRTGIGLLKAVAIAAGIAWSVLFVVVGFRYGLQLYGDGSVFSYSVAVQDAWTIHWHNISGRLFVYLSCFVPAEAVVAWTGNAGSGVAVYGLLHFAVQCLGLAATFAFDRSKGRIVFCYACFSTACVCPLVFGFPTEMWMAHALFWPTLAACHFARRGAVGSAAVFVLLLALIFTHEGALVLAVTILLTLVARGVRDAAFLRAAGAFVVAISIWFIVKAEFRPDPYIVDVMENAEMNFFNVGIFTGDLMLLLVGALASYSIAWLALRRLLPGKAEISAASIVAVALGLYWLRFDHSLHAEDRYFLRTVVLIGTAGLGVLAAAFVLAAEARLGRAAPRLSRLIASLAAADFARAIVGAIMLIALVHVVETAKFVAAWTDYKAAVRSLAMGTASDPSLGDPHFVSSARIGAELNRLSWSSTTPYLSILVAPGFAPARLVVDPDANYFWLSCKAAKSNEAAERAVPAASRQLLLTLECLHR